MGAPGLIVATELMQAFGQGPSALLALDRVTLHVTRGESVGIVGESGSGKTTLLRLLAGLLEPSAGSIVFAGEPWHPWCDPVQRRRVQLVFQDPIGSLHPRHRVSTILAEPLAIHGVGNRAERIRAALDAVALPASVLERFPGQLSGGQRQRVGIARALLLEPDVLLLDEPTSALDVSVQAEVLNLLQDLRDRLGMTYILVSHDIAVVAHMCERVVVMRRGAVVEEMMTHDLHAGCVAESYTRNLLRAAEGYERRR